MTRPESRSLGSARSAAWRALSLLIAFAAFLPTLVDAEPAASNDAKALPLADHTIASNKDIVVFPPLRGASSFRFLPDGSYVPFDRNLVLSAAPGEARSYLVQVATDTGGEEEGTVTGYLINKKRPLAPRAEPGTGLYYDGLRPALSCEDGAKIFWALLGPGGLAASFARYGEDSRPSLSVPASGTATYTILAYAVDRSGNRGYPSRFVYRLAEPGLAAAAPIPDSSAIKASPSLPKLDVDSKRGYSELRMAVPPGASLLLDINPDSPPGHLDDFEQVAADGGTAKLRIPCPYGWTNDLIVYYGLLKDGVASYNPLPQKIHLSNPAEEIPQPTAPEGPVLAADPAGRGAFAIFPSYDGALFVSVDGADPKPYTAPIALPLDEGSVKISWYGEDGSGQRSVSRVLSLPLPEVLPDVELAGAAEGALIGGNVTLKPTAKATLRYELRLDGSNPPEPGISSPLVGDSLGIACPEGEERSVVVRYRVFSGDSGGEGRILRFSIDRKIPDAPRPLEIPLAYSDKPTSLSLLPGSGAKNVFASVSANGILSPFTPVAGPLEFPGSEAGPVSYTLRAYDINAAGNRSPEMKSLSFVVDRASCYVAEDGSDKGDGSPDRPYRSLDLALAAALKGGKKIMNLRGVFEMDVPVVRSSRIELAGGFGKLWVKDPSARASVRIAVPQGQSAFSQDGGSLSLRQLDLKVEAAGSSPLIALSDSTLAIDDSSISAGAEGDLLLVSALRSKIDVRGSRINATRAMACTVFSSDGSDISVLGSSFIATKGVRVFGAFDMDGGALSLRESLIDSRADLGLNLISLRSASLLVDRSLFQVEGGSGFLRLGSFKTVQGEMKNSKVILSWEGPGILFEIADGGPAFRHDTIVADSKKGGLRFFDVRGELPQVWNSILDCSGTDSELLRSDSLPGQGVLVADCVWGFDKLFVGASEIRDLGSLNALNAGSVLYSSKPIVSESPESSFAAPLKSQAPLRAGSACVNAALPLESGYDVDFSGHRRPGPGKAKLGNAGPDIGADELVG
jgi:hypothetical protein